MRKIYRILLLGPFIARRAPNTAAIEDFDDADF